MEDSLDQPEIQNLEQPVLQKDIQQGITSQDGSRIHQDMSRIWASLERIVEEPDDVLVATVPDSEILIQGQTTKN